MNPGEFSVYQYFRDGTYERVRWLVDAEEAVNAAFHYSGNVTARMGLTRRVVITDGNDFINWEWQHGKGVVFGGSTPVEPLMCVINVFVVIALEALYYRMGPHWSREEILKYCLGDVMDLARRKPK